MDIGHSYTLEITWDAKVRRGNSFYTTFSPDIKFTLFAQKVALHHFSGLFQGTKYMIMSPQPDTA